MLVSKTTVLLKKIKAKLAPQRSSFLEKVTVPEVIVAKIFYTYWKTVIVGKLSNYTFTMCF